MLRNSLIFFAAFSVALIVFVWAENEVSPSFQSCISQNASQQSANGTKDNSYGVIRIIKSQTICSLRLIDRHNGFYAALATVAIAAFTATLWITNNRQLRLARDEFLSSHRPKIIVHAVEIAHDVRSEGYEPTLGASVVYFNIGDTPARITEINAKISMRPLPLQSGLGVSIGVRLTGLPVPRELIESGPPNFVAVRSEQTLENVRFAEKSREGRGQEGGLVCIGQIVYEDARHTRRETGFCRRLDTISERWVSMENSGYEYAY